MEQSLINSATEEQLRKFGDFLENHDNKLNGILRNCNDYTVSLNTCRVVKMNFSANQENLPILKLIDSDRLLNKCILTFASVCKEINEICVEAKEMQMKFLYIDEDLCLDENTINYENNTMGINERIIYKMSDHIEFICKIQFLVQRCVILANNILHQCGAFLACKNRTFEFKFIDIFDCFTNLIVQLLTFDVTLINSNFNAYWPTYKKTMEAITRNSEKFDFCAPYEIAGLLHCSQELDLLFSGNIFRSFLDSIFTIKEKIGPKAVGYLKTQFNDYMKINLSTIDKYNVDLCDFIETHRLIRINAFCVVYNEICGQVDSKYMRNILELNLKYPGITLIANIPWSPNCFFKKHAENLTKTHEKYFVQDAHSQPFLTQRVQSVPRECRSYCVKIALWSIRIQRALELAANDLKVENFNELSLLLLQGLEFAGKLSYITKALINMHASLKITMSSSTLECVCRMTEVIKMIQEVYENDMGTISKVTQCLIQHLQYKLLQITTNAKKKITINDRNADILAALKITEKCLNGPATHMRINITKLAIQCTNSNTRTLPNELYEKFIAIIGQIETFASFQDKTEQLCDTSFMHWHKYMLSSYLKLISENGIDGNSYKEIIKASNDCVKILDRLGLGNLMKTKKIKKSNYDSVRTEVISNLCAQTETYLRHESNPTSDTSTSTSEQNIHDCRNLIESSPIELNGEYIILRDHVENYLSNTFYNLTTISLHDWKMYEEMRHIAANQLNISPIENHLPDQTLQQSIDVLEIMRNIHTFVTRYCYNMNNQIFVEQRSSTNFLDVIGIKEIANSLRTHGSGIINTTVNFTYQFLRQKFYTFSQFLFDEQIRSRLMKEHRTLIENKEKNSKCLYAYERADSFNKDIRKLGLAQNNQTYIDLFRKLITHIGNAIGYVRLIRSGNIHANYSSSLYLPQLNDELKFVELAKKLNFDKTVIDAAENLEENIRNMSNNFSDGSNFFKLLVEAFEPFFRNPNNIHLKYFFLIVPPLTVNYVEYMINGKEKVNKNDHQDAVLFDDGFPVGLSYILKLLDQITDFNSLQWFTTMRDRFDAERKKVNELQSGIDKSSGGAASSSNINSNANYKEETEKLHQTLALTERRINAHQMEFNLLYYNLSSAKIFFLD